MITKNTLADAINSADVINTTSLDLDTAKVVDRSLRDSIIAFVKGDADLHGVNKWADLKVSTTCYDPDEAYTLEEAEEEMLEWLAGNMVQDAITLFAATLELLVDDKNFSAISSDAIAERIVEKYLGVGGRVYREVRELETKA